MQGVFISYRRDDTVGYAGRLYDSLIAALGRNLVFIDIDSIRAGENFVDVIEKRIASCSVVVVVIGKAWLSSTDDRGRRRLDDPDDFVRLEIVSALRQTTPVIPVLVGGAKMPRPEDLPAPLSPLAHLNAIEIVDHLFYDSLKHLINALHPLVYPRLRFWPWTRPVTRTFRLWVITLALLAALGTAAIFRYQRFGHPSSQTTTIFSDLGVGQTYTPYANNDKGPRVVSAGPNPPANSPAYSFVASATAAVTQIDLGLSYVSGTNTAVVSLWTAAPWSKYTGPEFGSIAPGVQLGAWVVGSIPSAASNSATTLTSIRGIRGISLVAGTEYFIQVSTYQPDTYVLWNTSSTGSASTLSQCGGYDPTYTRCKAGYTSLANVSDGAFDIVGATTGSGA